MEKGRQRVTGSFVILFHKLLLCMALMAEEPLAGRGGVDDRAGRKSARIEMFYRLCLSWVPAERHLAGA
jgi:hypothetical protein